MTSIDLTRMECKSAMKAYFDIKEFRIDLTRK